MGEYGEVAWIYFGSVRLITSQGRFKLIYSFEETWQGKSKRKIDRGT